VLALLVVATVNAATPSAHQSIILSLCPGPHLGFAATFGTRVPHGDARLVSL
jgi:hypothetical protein